MPAASDGRKDGLESDSAHSQVTKRKYRRWTEEDAKRWKKNFESGKSILEVAAADKVDPKLVSQWLHKLGVEVYQGRHRVEQLPLKIPSELIELLSNGPDYVLKFLDERVWGLTATESGIGQLRKFCKFIELHMQGTGVEDIASQLAIHRSSVAEWRDRTDQPYLVKTTASIVQLNLKPGWKALPLHLHSGGNEQQDWIQVPSTIQCDEDIRALVRQITPPRETFELAARLGISLSNLEQMQFELCGYLVGIALGDAGKTTSSEERFASMNLDLQFTKKKPSNEMLGELVCLAANLIGIRMSRIADKHPTGYTRNSKDPTDAYRWSSERSPLLAWIVRRCLGLERGKTTSHDKVYMDWIFGMSEDFRKRFVQGLEDSDGTVRPYVVEITSTPNTELVTRVLLSLGLASAYSRKEKGEMLRTVVRNAEAAKLPIFNEFTQGYRYQLLMSYTRKQHLPLFSFLLHGMGLHSAWAIHGKRRPCRDRLPLG